jgi:hypothetical protein
LKGKFNLNHLKNTNINAFPHPQAEAPEYQANPTPLMEPQVFKQNKYSNMRLAEDFVQEAQFENNSVNRIMQMQEEKLLKQQTMQQNRLN